MNRALSDWLILCKARIQVLSTPTACICTWMASSGQASWGLLASTAAGITLVSSSAAALNQLLEIEVDAQMERTQNRPLPAGRIKPRTVAGFITVTGVVGLLTMLWINPLAAWLALSMIVLYNFIYTPLKRVTPLNTLVGALPGAFPLLIGWAAAGNGLDLRAGVLFAILFLWQLPHFMAIAWTYREDYRRGGFVMPSHVSDAGESSARKSLAYALVLTLLVMAPFFAPLQQPTPGLTYLLCTVPLSLYIIVASAKFLWGKDRNLAARKLFHATIIYLPILFVALVVDRYL